MDADKETPCDRMRRLNAAPSRPVGNVPDNRESLEQRAQIANGDQQTIGTTELRPSVTSSSQLAQPFNERRDWKRLKDAQRADLRAHKVLSETERDTSERGSVSREPGRCSQTCMGIGIEESRREPQWEDITGFGRRVALPNLPTLVAPNVDQPKAKTSFPYPHHSHSTVAPPIVSFKFADSEIKPARKTSENLGEEPCTAWLQTRVDLEAARNRARGQHSVGEYW